MNHLSPLVPVLDFWRASYFGSIGEEVTFVSCPSRLARVWPNSAKVFLLAG